MVTLEYMEEGGDLVGFEGSPAQHGGTPNPFEVGRPVVFLGGHLAQPPRLAQHAAQGAERRVDRRRAKRAASTAGDQVSERGTDGLGVLVSQGGPGQFLSPETAAGHDPSDLIERLGHRATASGGEPGEVDPERVVVEVLRAEGNQVAGREVPLGDRVPANPDSHTQYIDELDLKRERIIGAQLPGRTVDM